MEGADRELILGLDFGTSSLKAALFDRDGHVAAQTNESYPLSIPQAGWAEQNPEDWWQALARAVRNLVAEAKGARIAGIGITAQMCGVVAVNDTGNALLPCPLWLDTRSEPIARELMAGWIKINGYGLSKTLYWLHKTGGAPNLSGKDPLTKILWLERNRPDVWPRVKHVLDVKDYLVMRLTGAMRTSFDCAHLTWLMDIRQKNWSDALLRKTGIAKTILPEIAAATKKAGDLSQTTAKELGLTPGIAVSVGLGDVCAAAFGVGAEDRRSLHFNIGTSLWFGAELGRHRVDPLHNIGTLLAGDGESHLLIATQENAGSCINWAADQLSFAKGDFQAMETVAAAATPDEDAPLFLPWISGERVPVDDSRLSAEFWNLKDDSNTADKMRAVYEGVALNARWAMGYFDKLAGAKGQALRTVGGGARSDFWCQLFADVLGRPLQRMDSPALAGARGAAMTAGVACGWYANIAVASRMARTERLFSPHNTKFYDARFSRFLDAYRHVKRRNRSKA